MKMLPGQHFNHRRRTAVLLDALEPNRLSGPSALKGIAVTRRPYSSVKPAIDWMAATVLFVIALPVLLVTMALVKATSAGPCFYSQTRLGRGGRLFRIYKLRTMTHNCEAVTGPVWSLADDPRVTRVGRWLRDTHLDELPQLWNVLRGEMSLVGPRPERPELAEKIERTLPEFRARLLVRPGITGLAQVRLPPDADIDTVQRKLTFDLHYVRNLGMALDARIAVSTGLQLLSVAINSASRQFLNRCVPTDEISPAFEPSHDDLRHLRGPTMASVAERDLPAELQIAA